MSVPAENREGLQWHPAFYAGIQIELEQETDRLTFENEHQLGTKPKEVDVLIIKKNADQPIEKNIGRIFRKHNLVEYKSPTDYLSIDDFYKVYGYACFYKSDTKTINEIPIEDLTITYVSSHRPRELLKHLRERGYQISQVEAGIYYIEAAADLQQIPMQLIILTELSAADNLWLKSLSNDIRDAGQIQKLSSEYGKYKDQNLYQSVMNVIIRANKEKFKEEKNVCEALRELFQDELSEGESKGERKGKIEGKIEGEELKVISQILHKLEKHLDVETIAEHLEEATERVQKIVELKKQYPEADREALYKILHAPEGH
ncbi:MAG: 3-isopropylmalate dehydrogenase [Lachnospiraceae bacterium]|nr:3-isopropylmalate dehydrogenase [Lachnospiraceae bacterium]